MNEASPSYGTTRDRGPTVSYAEIERAARAVMAQGSRPTGRAVLEHLGRGSPNHIAEAMRRFWRDQAALNAGDPLALSRLPPELADAAVAQWEQALRLAQQTVGYENSAARSQLDQLRRDAEAKVRSIELREKEWDMAARVRERALADVREQINALMTELALDRAELRARDVRIADLESQLERRRQQLATIVARAVAKSRTGSYKLRRSKTPKAARRRVKAKKASSSRKGAARSSKKKLR